MYLLWSIVSQERKIGDIEEAIAVAVCFSSVTSPGCILIEEERTSSYSFLIRNLEWSNQSYTSALRHVRSNTCDTSSLRHWT